MGMMRIRGETGAGDCSNQVHAQCGTFLAHVIGPDAGLDFSYMAFVEQDKAKTALSNTSSDGKRQLVAQQLLMEEKVHAVHLSSKFQLAEKCLFVHADSHR